MTGTARTSRTTPTTGGADVPHRSLPTEDGTSRVPAADSPPAVVGTGDGPGASSFGYATNKSAHLKRMARIEGQVRGIARMIDEDKYCIDVLTQVSAVTKALQAVSLALLEEHMAHCVAHAVAAGPEQGEPKLREAAAAIARLVRS